LAYETFYVARGKPFET